MQVVAALKDWAKQALSDSQRRELASYRIRFKHGGDLTKLAIAYGSDKAGPGQHNYTPHYQRYFAHLRRRRLNILEVGIGGYGDPHAGGGSLRMWKAYFPNSLVFGIDVFDKSPHNERRIRTFQGSQVDESFLRDVVREIGPLDIVIDDGSHRSEHVIATFDILFPLMSPDGIYAVEDLQTSYWDNEGWDGSRNLDATHTSMCFFKRLADGLNYEEFLAEDYKPTYADRHVVSVSFYHNLVIVQKGANNEGSNVVGRCS